MLRCSAQWTIRTQKSYPGQYLIVYTKSERITRASAPLCQGAGDALNTFPGGAIARRRYGDGNRASGRPWEYGVIRERAGVVARLCRHLVQAVLEACSCAGRARRRNGRCCRCGGYRPRTPSGRRRSSRQRGPGRHDADEHIDEAKLRRQVDFVIEHGVDGILAFGSNSEFYMFDDDEMIAGDARHLGPGCRTRPGSSSAWAISAPVPAWRLPAVPPSCPSTVSPCCIPCSSSRPARRWCTIAPPSPRRFPRPSSSSTTTPAAAGTPCPPT